VTAADVEEALHSKDANLGYLALLRYDQLNELDALLSGRVTKDRIEAALSRMKERLARSDWQPTGDCNDRKTPLEMFLEMRKDQTRDHRMVRLVHVAALPTGRLPRGLARFDAPYQEYLMVNGQTDRPPETIRTASGDLTPDPILRYLP
jgi:hypothetical protein